MPSTAVHQELSHVGMGYKLCPACHEKHDETVLLHKRLRNTLPRESFMGYELCPKHAAMSEEYVALVEMTGDPKVRGTQFTGNVAHVRWEAAARIFNIPMTREHPWVFVEVGVIEKLQQLPVAKGE